MFEGKCMHMMDDAEDASNIRNISVSAVQFPGAGAGVGVGG